MKALRTPFLILAVTLLLCAVAYFAYRHGDYSRMYAGLKDNSRGWVNSPHVGHPELGMALEPGALGAETYATGPDIPTRISSQGFRIPLDAPDPLPLRRPLVLSLGCSFTFGSSCLAEETHAWLAGQMLSGTGLNAGVSSHGLAQMLLLARKLVPEYKPEYVLAQYSPWLVDRAVEGYLPTFQGKLPSPFFYRTEQGLLLHPPYYPSRVFAYDMERYKLTPTSLMDRLSFYRRVAVPLFAHDDWHDVRTSLRRIAGSLPPPATDRLLVLEHVFAELLRICEENGAELLILALDDVDLVETVSGAEKEFLGQEFGERFVDTTPALRRHVPGEQGGEASRRIYAHYREGRIVDWHPNALAHRLYAEAAVQRIRQLFVKSE